MSTATYSQGVNTNIWVLASNNAHKLAELAQPLSVLGKSLRPQSEWQVADAIEDGLSFQENAIIKARHAAQATGLPAIADDSGLVVDALGGAPGLYSARYAGVHGDDVANRGKLLQAMTNIPANQRQASFVCVLAAVRHADDPLPILALGQWHGSIATTERGENGFGYDPIFIPQGESITAAEMLPYEKQLVSHRALAINALAQQFEQLGDALF